MIGRRIGRACGALLIATLLLAPLSSITASVAHAAPPQTGQGVQAQITGDPLVPGSAAIVRADSGCLRLRDAPSLSSGRELECIPDGRTLLVLPGTAEADGYRWQLVTWREVSGWAADAFLAPHDGPVADASCQPSTQRPGLAGNLPAQGGFGLALWGGGTLAGLETSTTAGGCRLSSVWSNRPGGGFVGYRFGAPDFVNQPWRDVVSSTIAAGTPLLLVCDPPGAAISTRSVPIPLPSQDAPVRTGAASAPDIDARAAVVIDEASGEVLYEHNARDPLPPASLTKIATAILAMEGAILNSWVPVSDVDYRKMPGSSVMGIVPGDCFLLSDLLYGLLLPSGNDAALAIARYQGGSDEGFVNQMNALARRLGLTDTSFTDPHGLGSASHRTSAYDIAMMSRYAMQFPLFREIVSTPSWTAVGDRDLAMRNVNSFLGQFNDADGVKTGFTEAAGRTLSASATRGGHRLYAVILNDADRNADAGKLLDWAFANFTWP